jgi:cytochrome c biogenesis protein CcmG, thiol:disulfide interchange protein DsbE
MDGVMQLVRSRLVLVAAVALALAGCGGGSKGSSASPVALPSSATAMPTFSANQFRELLTTLKGKPVVVNVWASWCGPCTKEAPSLAQVSAQYAGRVQFLGVDIEDQLTPARTFIAKYGWTYPSVFDPTGSIRDDLGLLGQPVTILYDATGTKVFSWSGATSPGQLAAEIAKIVPA